MVKKNIRTYTPGKGDFLHFANTMNKNEMLNRQQNQQLDAGNLGQITVDGDTSPLQPNGAVKAQNTETVGTVEPQTDLTGAATDGAAQSGAVETPTVGTDTPATGGATLTGGTSISGAPSWETYKTNNGVMEEADWYAANALDPDVDYQNAVNTLNYEYQTSLATYGENAEKLRQMGLQNSGVSDIFQANAFSTYLANMNSAANARIAAKKQNKALYNAYITEQKGGYNTYVQNWQTAVNDAVTAIQQSGLTSESTDEAIRTALQSYGVTDVSSDLIAQVKTRLGNVENVVKEENERVTEDAIGTIDQALVDATGGGERANTYEEYKEAETSLDALASEGADKDTINAKKEEYRQKRVELLTNVSKGTNKDIDNAYKTLGQEFLGVSEEEWKNMSDGDQRHYIVEKAGELVGTKGGLTREEYGQIVSDWVDIETESMIKANNESKDNNAFIRAGALTFKLEELYSEGQLTEEQYKDEVNRIISNIGFGHRAEDRATVIGWSETVKKKDSSWLGVQITTDSANNKVSDDIVSTLNEKLTTLDGDGLFKVKNNASTRGDYTMVVLDGNLYATDNAGSDWWKVDYQDIAVYDSDWSYRYPTDNQKRGMYQLLVTMLENKETNDADARAQKDKEESANQYQQDIEDKYSNIYSDLTKDKNGK